MSFGYGVGDIIAVSKLAWKVYRSCQDSGDEFKALSGEVLSMHALLRETAEETEVAHIRKNKADSKKKKKPGKEGTDIDIIIDGCNGVLADTEKLLEKYASLGTHSQRVWDRVKFGAEDINGLRIRFISNITLLTSYKAEVIRQDSHIVSYCFKCAVLVLMLTVVRSYFSNSHSRLERKVDLLIREVRAGKREGSIVSTYSLETIPRSKREEKEFWREVRRELRDIGVSSEMLRRNRVFVIDRLKGAFTADVAKMEHSTGENPTVQHPTVEKHTDAQPAIADSTVKSSRHSLTERSEPIDASPKDAPEEPQDAPVDYINDEEIVPEDSASAAGRSTRARNLGKLSDSSFSLRDLLEQLASEPLCTGNHGSESTNGISNPCVCIQKQKCYERKANRRKLREWACTVDDESLSLPGKL